MSGTRSLILVWLALVVLISLSIAGSFVFQGPANLVVSFGTALAKAALIFWFYMHLKTESGLNRVFSVAAVAWLGVLMGLSGVDFLTR